MLRTESISFHPVIRLPDELEIYDFTAGYDPNRKLSQPYGVGKHDELRPGMYKGAQFEGVRNIHMGVDIGCPAGERVFAFYAGTIHKLGDNDRPYDYGPTIITRHEWLGQVVFALHGHLSRSSLARWAPGDAVAAGELLATVGERTENGGWNPHLHFQLSLIEPHTHDLPGAVSAAQRAQARADFPDPRLVLGPLY